jgi:hypothetical protein
MCPPSGPFQYYTEVRGWVRVDLTHPLFSTTILISKYMSKRLPLQSVEIIIDTIYHNTTRDKFSQLSGAQLAKHCEVSINTFRKVESILIDRKLLCKEGVTRNMRMYWNPGRALPNPTMARDVFKEYSKDARHSEVRVKQKRSASTSLESAVRVLVKLGYTGIISKVSIKGYVKHTESIDLSQIGEE